MKHKTKSSAPYIKLVFVLIFCVILYLVYIAVMDTINEINKKQAAAQLNDSTDSEKAPNFDAPPVTASSLTMQNDGNYEAVIKSYSNYTLQGERNTAIVIVSNQLGQLYAKTLAPNPGYLLDQQLYNLLKSTSVSQFESYIETYYPAFKNAGDIMTFYNDGNYQAVVVPFANERFSNKLYGDARNAAIVMLAEQIGASFPSTGPFNTSGLNDRQLYNLLTVKSFKSFKSLIKSYYPDRQF